MTKKDPEEIFLDLIIWIGVVILIVVVTAVLSFKAGHIDGRYESTQEWKVSAIQSGYGEHNRVSGEFQWIQPEPEGDTDG